MVLGFTDSFECPECASTQRARVLEMAGQRVARLQCVTCETAWDPRVPASMQRAVDFDVDDETKVTPADQHAE